MALSPNDIVEREFKTRFRGYDPDEVRIFLEEVAEELTALVKERNSMKNHASALKTQVEELKKRDDELRVALTTAHSISEELKRQSEKEAELTVERARLEAERIVSDAHKEALRLEDRIRALRRLQREAAHRIRSNIEGYLRILDEDSLPGEEIDELLSLTAAELRSIQDRPRGLDAPSGGSSPFPSGEGTSGEETWSFGKADTDDTGRSGEEGADAADLLR